MSTGRECELIEVRPGEWFFLLENDFTPVGAWDWREHDPYCGGPYPTLDACADGLHENHANPGGWFQRSLAPGQTEAKLSEPVAKAVAEARKRGTARRW